MLIPLYKIGGVHFRLLGTDGFHVKAKNERFTAASSRCRHNLNREFKIYDATVAKTSLKIGSSTFSIYFAIMSVCLTFESARNYPGTEFRGAVSTLEKNIQICA